MGLLTLEENLLPEDGKPVRLPKKKSFRKQVFLVTDTSWWMEMAERGWAVRDFSGSVYVIPQAVFRELDGLKRNERKAQYARWAFREIQRLAKQGKAGIATHPRGKVWNVLNSSADEEVVNVGLAFKKHGYETKLLSTDTGQIALAEIKGLKCEGVMPPWKEREEMKAFKDFVKKVGIVLMLFMGFIMFLGFFSGNTGMGVIGTCIIGGWFLHRQWKEARKYNERYEPKKVFGFQGRRIVSKTPLDPICGAIDVTNFFIGECDQNYED